MLSWPTRTSRQSWQTAAAVACVALPTADFAWSPAPSSTSHRCRSTTPGQPTGAHPDGRRMFDLRPRCQPADRFHTSRAVVPVMRGAAEIGSEGRPPTTARSSHLANLPRSRAIPAGQWRPRAVCRRHQARELATWHQRSASGFIETRMTAAKKPGRDSGRSRGDAADGTDDDLELVQPEGDRGRRVPGHIRLRRVGRDHSGHGAVGSCRWGSMPARSAKRSRPLSVSGWVPRSVSSPPPSRLKTRTTTVWRSRGRPVIRTHRAADHSRPSSDGICLGGLLIMVSRVSRYPLVAGISVSASPAFDAKFWRGRTGYVTAAGVCSMLVSAGHTGRVSGVGRRLPAIRCPAGRT